MSVGQLLRNQLGCFPRLRALTWWWKLVKKEGCQVFEDCAVRVDRMCDEVEVWHSSLLAFDPAILAQLPVSAESALQEFSRHLRLVSVYTPYLGTIH